MNAKALLGGKPLVATVAVLVGLAGAAPAHGAGWEVRQIQVVPADYPGKFPYYHSNIQGVSCPSESLCVAVAETNAVISSTNPTGGAGAWQLVRPLDPSVEGDFRCASPPTEFVAAGCGDDFYRSVRGVSCPAPSLCVAVTFDGYVYSSTNPAGPASSWGVADVDGTERDTHLESVSCPDQGFCVAVSGNRHSAGKVLASTDPAGPGSAWRVTQLDESLDLRGVSCTSRDFCLAVAAKGRVLVSTNPGGGASAWKEIGTPGGPGDLESASCIDVGSFLCLTGNSGGNLLAMEAPGTEASSWSEANGGRSVQITGVSCPLPSRCIAVDNNGDVLVSTNPSGPTGSWSASNLSPYEVPSSASDLPYNALFAANCPTTTLCVLAGSKGRIFTNTDPFATTAAAAGPGKRSSGRRLRKRPRTVLVKADGFREVTPTHRLRARFRFFARSKVRGFVCKRDRGRYKRCRSPLRYWVPLGKHALRVRAIGPTGLRGPVAAIGFEAIHNPKVD